MEQSHQCFYCGKNDVKLYRIYGNFLLDIEIYCKKDAPAGWIDRQILVPLIEDIDGNVFLYTSVPTDAIKRWNNLPD